MSEWDSVANDIAAWENESVRRDRERKAASEPDYEYAPKGTSAELAELRVENERLRRMFENMAASTADLERAERAETEVERLVDEGIEQRATIIGLENDLGEARDLAEALKAEILRARSDETVEHDDLQLWPFSKIDERDDDS